MSVFTFEFVLKCFNLFIVITVLCQRNKMITFKSKIYKIYDQTDITANRNREITETTQKNFLPLVLPIELHFSNYNVIDWNFM